jgi:hypothetical protein
VSLSSPRYDLHPPCLSRTFTSFAAQVVLANNVSNSVPNGAPVNSNINHLPASIFVVAEAGDTFAFTDVLGNVNSMTFVAPFYGTLPFTAATIETTTDCPFVTVSWNPEP